LVGAFPTILAPGFCLGGRVLLRVPCYGSCGHYLPTRTLGSLAVGPRWKTLLLPILPPTPLPSYPTLTPYTAYLPSPGLLGGEASLSTLPYLLGALLLGLTLIYSCTASHATVPACPLSRFLAACPTAGTPALLYGRCPLLLPKAVAAGYAWDPTHATVHHAGRGLYCLPLPAAATPHVCWFTAPLPGRCLFVLPCSCPYLRNSLLHMAPGGSSLLPAPPGWRPLQASACSTGHSLGRDVPWTCLPAPVHGDSRRPAVHHCMHLCHTNLCLPATYAGWVPKAFGSFYATLSTYSSSLLFWTSPYPFVTRGRVPYHYGTQFR